MKTTAQLVTAVVASLPPATSSSSHNPVDNSEPVAKPKRIKPLHDEWERKWFDMEVHHPDVQMAADTVRLWLLKWFHNLPAPPLLVLVGCTGCGKTHLARKAAYWASRVAVLKFEQQKLAEVPATAFESFAGMANSKEMEGKEWTQTMKEIDRASLFVLDDIGTETDPFRDGEPVNRLTEILNRRARRFTLITTNVAESLWAERWDARVADRLRRFSEVVVVNAPSFVGWKP